METTKRKSVVTVWGDSLAKGVVWNAERRRHGYAAETAADVVSKKLNVEIVNRARFGFTAPQGLAMIEKDLEDGWTCDTAVIEFGGNDCNFDWAAISDAPDAEHDPMTKPGAFEEALRRIIEKLRCVAIRPVLVTLPPIDAEKYFEFLVGDKLNPANILKWLGDKQRIYRFQEMYSLIVEKVARETDCKLIDLRRHCLENRAMYAMICEDGLHLNEKGQIFVGNEISRMILQGEA